jgi:hypothetical protein
VESWGGRERGWELLASKCERREPGGSVGCRRGVDPGPNPVVPLVSAAAVDLFARISATLPRLKQPQLCHSLSYSTLSFLLSFTGIHSPNFSCSLLFFWFRTRHATGHGLRESTCTCPLGCRARLGGLVYCRRHPDFAGFETVIEAVSEIRPVEE